MKETLSHVIRFRLTDTDYKRLVAAHGDNPIWIRSAIRGELLVHESIHHKVNSEERDVSAPAEQ